MTISDAICYTILTFTNFYKAPSFFNPFSVGIYGTGVALMHAWHIFILAVNIPEAVAHCWEFMCLIWDHGLPDYLMNNLNWVDAIYLITTISATLALGVVTGGASLQAAMAILITGCWLTWAIWLGIDWKDNDSLHHETYEGGGGGGRPPLIQ